MTLNMNSTSGQMRISGKLDIDAASALREALIDCLLCRREIAIDLSEVDGCDAAALQVLLAARMDASAAGMAFQITAASDAVNVLVQALGLSLDVPQYGPAGGPEKCHPHAV